VQRFDVTTERVAESAVVLGGLSGEARGATVLIARGADAAAQTAAEGALSELTLNWGNALGRLGAVTDSMDDLERAFALIRENADDADFVGPRDAEMIEAAESALGLSFPATGDGDFYVLDTTSAPERDGPIVIFMPGVPEDDAPPPEHVANDFGAFLADMVTQALE
jgi:hypothetical protein